MDKIFETKGRKRDIETNIKGIRTDGNIIAICKLDLCTGGALGFRNYGQILETTLYGDCDISMYMDDYNLKAEEKCNDRTNILLFRELKPELSPAQIKNFYNKLSKNDLSSISHYTNSLLKYIA